MFTKRSLIHFAAHKACGGFGRHHHRWGKDEPGLGHGFGRRFGPPHGGRRFGRGDLKYVILDLLKEQPRHGYDVIRALEERFQGFYSPSPGSVYPTLQLLEDRGFVTSSEAEGKRVYTITDDGRSFLEERAGEVDDIHARMHAGWEAYSKADVRALVQDVRHLAQDLMGQVANGALRDADKMRRLRETIARAKTDIEAIFRDDEGTPPSTVL
jgi:DNA-binding PadR family transcriptional regulator